jgi:hypothetical protein
MMSITPTGVACVALLGALAFAGVAPAYACSFDTDCTPGSKCMKERSALYGVCLAGIAPGNKHDRQPVYAPLDPNRTYGNTCSFDTDCGPGSACVKEAGSIYGACLKRGRTVATPEQEKSSSCSFNTDCPIGAKCLKESGRIRGTCVK